MKMGSAVGLHPDARLVTEGECTAVGRSGFSAKNGGVPSTLRWHAGCNDIPA